MSALVQATEPFVEYLSTRVVEAGPARAVVEQPAVRELDNHVGVRHASALHAAGYEASRALIAAALGPGAVFARAFLAGSDISYTAVGLGLLTTTAEPSGAGWDTLAIDLAAGSAVTLTSVVRTTDEEGKTVAKLEVSWTVEPVS